MKTICFFNNKGGVGKTTLLCNLAAYLSIYHNKKILVVDADPQCNSSAYLLPEDKLEEILFDEDKANNLDKFYEPIRRGRGELTKPNITTSERFKIDVIVGHPRLALTEDLLANDWSATKSVIERGFRTTFAMAELFDFNKEYDYILIDMGPSLGALNRSILLCSDYFLMPLSVDIFSMMAVSNIHSSFEKWKRDIEKALSDYKNERGKDYSLVSNDLPIKWKLNFLGYVRQLYRAKSIEGVRQHVKAYERIITKQDEELEKMGKFFGFSSNELKNKKLGEIPTLSSVIPLSQQAHAPIFELNNNDGIVGGHYSRVAEAKEFFEMISANFLRELGDI